MRLEVTVRSLEEVGDAVRTLKEHRLKRVDVNHVSEGVDPIAVSRSLLTEIPDLDLLLHLSLKYFAGASLEESRSAFRRAVSEARKAGVKKILIVSGHPRKTFDTVDALRTLQEHGLNEGMEVWCVYNPFFDPARLREENDRLRAKLAYGFVSGLCFQIGMDTQKIVRAAELIRSIRPNIGLYGEVPVPSDRTLNRLKLAALYGVFLPNSYFFSAESARTATEGLMSSYRAQDVEPIVFSAHLGDVSDALPLFAA